MRIIKNKDITVDAAVRVPPGAYISRFYHAEDLTATTSGVDVHPTGARLIRVHGRLVIPSSSGDVKLLFKKNGEGFKEILIPEEGHASELTDVAMIESSISMDFAGSEDELQVEILETGSGAATLTAYGFFDR